MCDLVSPSHIKKTAKIRTKECNATEFTANALLPQLSHVHGTGRISLTGRIILSGHLLHTKPFTRNFELLSVYISVRLRWYSMNRTPKAHIFNRSNIRLLPCERNLKIFYLLFLDAFNLWNLQHVKNSFFYWPLFSITFELQTDSHRRDHRKCPYSNEVSVLCA